MRLALLGLAAAAALAVAAPSGAQDDQYRVLVFSKTASFRHASIEIGVGAVQRLGDAHGFAVDATEDAGAFTPDNLSRYAAVMFLNTTGNVLDEPQRAALERYVRGGGGYVGVHSAADTEYTSPFYETLVGARFKSHPIQQLGGFVREDAAHPATAHFPERFTVFDELYSFQTNPRPRVHVLLNVDESTYSPDPNTTDLAGMPETGVMGDHPMAWCQDVGHGRSFYTALGHEPYLYFDERFLTHLRGGIETAAGRVEADCSPPPGGAAEPLRVQARCLPSGDVRVRLVGDRAGVTRVRYRAGGRRVGRTLGPRSQGKRLRAIVRRGDERLVLRVRLPRC